MCLLAYDGLCTFEFGIGVEIFALPRPEFEHWYTCRTIAAEAGPLRATGGITVSAEHDLGGLSAASLVLIPGWRGVDEPVPAALCEALRDAHHAGVRLASICSGVFVLAASGLLDDRRATTHWRYADALARRYPRIEVQPDVLFVDEGDVLTSAGSAAGLDLCLHIVRRDYGAEHANAVARRLVVPALRDGGQRQFIPRPAPSRQPIGIAPLFDRVRGRLDEDWPAARLARIANLSPRTLARRFIEATGLPPHAWVTRERIARAADLLETSDAALGDIAVACGFGSLETFRREFRRQRGIPPSAHRKRFRTAPRRACDDRLRPPGRAPD